MSPEDLERIETLLPESVDSIGLVLDLDALVRRNGLQIAKVIIGDVSKKTSEGEGAIVEASAAATPLESSTISISVVGTYANIKNFLRSIESSLRAVDIVSLSLPKSDTGVYEATLTLRAYWVEKQKIPALESANTSDATIL
jgi:Tfp pilus assembly protein PilO